MENRASEEKRLSAEKLQELIDDAIAHAKAIASKADDRNASLNPLNRVLHRLWMHIANAAGDTAGGYAPEPDNDQDRYREQFFRRLIHRLQFYSATPLDESDASDMVISFMNKVQEVLK